MFNSAAALERELAPGERLLWSGQPRQGLKLESKDWFLIPFGILWFGLALFWEIKMLESAARDQNTQVLLFLLFGFPFVLAGFYLLVGRFLLDARSRARTACGITNRRILVIRDGTRRTVQTVELSQVREVRLEERPDRSGTIRILLPGAADSYVKAGREQRFAITPGLRLDSLPRVRDVYDTIQQARQHLPSQ